MILCQWQTFHTYCDHKSQRDLLTDSIELFIFMYYSVTYNMLKKYYQIFKSSKANFQKKIVNVFFVPLIKKLWQSQKKVKIFLPFKNSKKKMLWRVVWWEWKRQSESSYQMKSWEFWIRELNPELPADIGLSIAICKMRVP